ncbi:MAG: hypothetical protein H6R41_618, partial [Deltaproteobacteria bacterium]|nr:hypothetical protein [Deltaproteobacteria bacterium]
MKPIRRAAVVFLLMVAGGATAAAEVQLALPPSVKDLS